MTVKFVYKTRDDVDRGRERGANLGHTLSKMCRVWRRPLIFTLPQIGFILLFAPTAILAGIYAKYFGLSLTQLATVTLIARVFDAVTDPLIGYWSDRVREKTGSRKLFILAGALMMLPCSWFLYVPTGASSDDVPAAGVLYFGVFYVGFFGAATLYLMPYMAWASEFTKTNDEKVRCFTSMNVLGMAGSLILFSLPFLPYFLTTDVTPEVLKLATILGALLFLPSLVLALKIIPDGDTVISSEPNVSWLGEIKELYGDIVRNAPFLRHIAILIIAGLGAGMWTGLFFTFVDSYLEQGAAFASLSFIAKIAYFLSIPVWYKIVVHFGKRLSWLAYLGGVVLFYLSLSLLRPGFSSEFITTLYVFYLVVQAPSGIIAGPIMCDIIDYARLRKERSISGFMFALNGLLTKTPLAIGMALSLAIAGWFGYDAAIVGGQTASAEFGMLIGVSWLPALFTCAGLFLIYRMPLSEKRMEIVRKRLAQREARSAASRPVDPAASGQNVSSETAPVNA